LRHFVKRSFVDGDAKKLVSRVKIGANPRSRAFELIGATR